MANEILTPALQFISGVNLPTTGDGFLPTVNQQTAVAAALERLDGGRPRVVWSAITAPGATATFDLSALTGWVDTISEVRAVYWPWVLGNEDDSVLPREQWAIIQDPTNLDTLMLRECTPASGEKILVEYTILWTEATVPSTLKYKVAKLAAANMCRMIAARMAQQNESTIQVDTFRGNTASGDWLRMAKEFEAEYERAMGGAADDGLRPVSLTGSIDVRPDPFHGYKGPYPYMPEVGS